MWPWLGIFQVKNGGKDFFPTNSWLKIDNFNPFIFQSTQLNHKVFTQRFVTKYFAQLLNLNKYWAIYNQLFFDQLYFNKCSKSVRACLENTI